MGESRRFPLMAVVWLSMGGSMKTKIKTGLFLIAMLLCAFSLRASPPIGAAVASWNYDAAKKMLTLQIVNMSGKDITAFHMLLTITYADGSTASQAMSEDYLPLMATASIAAEDADFRSRYGNGTFAAGTKRDKVVSATKDVRSVNGVVDVVAYADQTADVSNDEAFNHLLTMRKGMLLAAQRASDAVKGAAAEADPKAAAATEIERLAKAAGGRNRGTADDPEMYTDMFLHQLSSNARSASDLAEFTRHNEMRIATLTPHTQLKKAVQP
jgi:hypothetical protein